jgi:hypothetical protein
MALYDDANYIQLMSDLKTVSTFAAVAEWDSRAQAEIEITLKAVQVLDAEIAKNAQELEQEKRAKAAKSFLGKMFSDDKKEKELAQLIEKYRRYQEKLNSIAFQLQESIDFTPNSPDDTKNLLAELKQRKKELKVEKREIAANMKSLRTEARQLSSDAGVVSGLFGGKYYDPTTAARERRGIRYQKEAALRPHEDAKAAIERQLIQVEKDILWAEKFIEANKGN